MSQIAAFPFLVLCCMLAAAGIAGAMLGAWIHVRCARAQIRAQHCAFEAARDQAERNLHRALACVPQWIQQSVRVEMEYQTRRQSRSEGRRWEEQQRWQSEQDARRQAEWRALQRMPPQVPELRRRRSPASRRLALRNT